MTFDTHKVCLLKKKYIDYGYFEICSVHYRLYFFKEGFEQTMSTISDPFMLKISTWTLAQVILVHFISVIDVVLAY